MGSLGGTLGLEKGFGTMWNPGAMEEMMGRNDKELLMGLGEAYNGAADGIGIQNLAPRDVGDTLRQSGMFVFRGEELRLEHFDAKAGDNCDMDAVLASIGK